MFYPPLDSIPGACPLTIPVYKEIRADTLTPVSAFLKLQSKESFLLESVTGGEKLARYSFIGSINGQDPLLVIQDLLKDKNFLKVPGLPSFTGGAVGFITYDCVEYFEPKTANKLPDTLGIPDALFLVCDELVIFDHISQVHRVISNVHYDGSISLAELYKNAQKKINEIVTKLQHEHVPEPPQPPIKVFEAENGIGEEGYAQCVQQIKHHINEGNVIQVVPSHRIKRKTFAHPFNVYRTLRSINPSPYMFYIDLLEYQLVGASPEMLVKVDDGKVWTHPIAGTRKRGKDEQEDKELADDLLSDEKERAEHVMLVDLGRNDVNRVCEQVKVESFMHIERYAHVMHIVSNVSGRLRNGKTSLDAFRSVFPAGTVSGAPKVRALQVIGDLEKEKRRIYAGAVGHFDYSCNLDTCIAIRTMVFKDGYAYFQAGGGIVFDSEEQAEYEETVNKMKSNMIALDLCEKELMTGSRQEKLFGRLALSSSEVPRLISHPADTLTVLIDNYDSFTWNIYQFLCQEGANVQVFRNDVITLDDCIALKPLNIVISPGPGRPSNSAGVSNSVIKHFAGVVPILGVCLGEQCMGHIFGSNITYAGEITHGKTSPIKHDGKGLFADIHQHFQATRYHSLVVERSTINHSVFVISAELENGLVMGIRHKEYVMEGVQFHPESVASDYGRKMIQNFLGWKGGKWTGEDKPKVTTQTESILLKIKERRLKDVEEAKKILGNSTSDLNKMVEIPSLLPTVMNLHARLSNRRSVMAEMKRASPSKGLIAANANAAEIAKEYAEAGAAVMSVLTEPTWFHGSINDLRVARKIADSFSPRPLILRKDFIVDEHQIYEARLAGADTILIIVAMLEIDQLTHLINVARELNMEPLVEVNSKEEMLIALQLGAIVIGVNNRNLHNFDVNMNCTLDALAAVPKDKIISGEIVVCALSGVNAESDLRQYWKNGISAVLVGESLMKSNSKETLIRKWLGRKTRVKICGVRRFKDAVKCAEAGADFVGMIMVPNTKRCVEKDEAKRIAFYLNEKGVGSVGVFMNQSLEFVVNQSKSTGISAVQLHGREDDEYVETLRKALTRVKIFRKCTSAKVPLGFADRWLIEDAEIGGSGELSNWSHVSKLPNKSELIVAGGIDPENASDAVKLLNPWMIDVSSGVEGVNCFKDQKKIEAIVKATLSE